MKQNLTLVVEEGSYAQTFAWEQGFTCLLNEACEAALPEGTFIYQVLGDQTARIIGYQGTARQLTLPESLQGHPVTAIGENAFAKQPLEQVILPEGLKAIGHGAFWDCTLREVRIPDSVTRVEGNPFLWCDELETIDISPDQPVLALINGVLYHKGEKKLVFCSPALGKTNLEIPRGIRVIGIGAVEMNRELETLLLPETLERIEAGAFSTCTALKEIILPEGVTELAPRSFADCSALKNVTVPDSVIAIGDGCFTGAAVTLTVGRDSCAREYARANGLDYTYPDALDWLNE